MSGGVGIQDDGVFLIVPAQTSCIEIGAPHCTKPPVHHNDLGVVESRRVHPYIAARLHQVVCIEETVIGSQWYVASGAEHDLDFHASFNGFAQGFFQLVAECEVRVDDFNGVFGIVDGVQVKVADDVVACVRLTVDDADGLLVGRWSCVWFQSLEVVLPLGPIVLWPVYVLAAHFVPHAQEYLLKRVHLIAVYAAEHVVPAPH